MMQCTACGTHVFRDAKFCEQGGVRLLTRSFQNTELQPLEQKNNSLQVNLVISINYIVIILIVVFAFITLVRPHLIYEQTHLNGLYYVTITKSFSSSIIGFFFSMALAVLCIRLNKRLGENSYKARNYVIALYLFNVLMAIHSFNILRIAVSLFVILTLLFNKELQELWQ